MCGVLLLLLVLTIMIPSPLDDDAVGRLATGSMATADPAGLLPDSAGWWSDDARRSDDTGFSDAGFSAEDGGGGGFISTGDVSVFTESCTGRDGGFDVGRGGVLLSSAGF